MDLEHKNKFIISKLQQKKHKNSEKKNTAVALTCILDSIQVVKWSFCPSQTNQGKYEFKIIDEEKKAFKVDGLIKEDTQVFR